MIPQWLVILTEVVAATESKDLRLHRLTE